MYVIQWIRSLLFNIQMYVMMLIIGIIFLIPMILHPWGAHRACMLYARWVIWTARWMVGLKVEVRGTPPTDPVLIAAKHQSFLDIMVIFANIPWGKFVMKQELMYAPILGVFSRRLGCIPVNRGKGASAVKKMLSDVEQGHAMPGQVVIYPQGTRVNPGEKRPYKVGVAKLYAATGYRCVPVALNIGLYWPKRGVMRNPGTAIVEFLDPIETGLETAEFMERLEAAIEPRSNELMTDAGFIG